MRDAALIAMTATVRDFMNRKLVYLPEGARPEAARRHILDFGITAVPVVDREHRPVGVVSLRDLADTRVREAQVSEPVHTIGVDERLGAAGRALAEADVHHLVVVDAEGRAVGMLSALDVIRGLLGMAPHHPSTIDAAAP
jgi:CBS-domain-containing membrane protein